MKQKQRGRRPRRGPGSASKPFTKKPFAPFFHRMKLSTLRLLSVVALLSFIATWCIHGAQAAAVVGFAQAGALAHLANPKPWCLGVYTQIQDVIQPDIWIPATIQRSVELSELIRAGIIDADPQFDALADEGGVTSNMPFWNDLAGEDEVLSDQNPLTTGKIDMAQDVAVNNNRGKAWKHNDLAKIFSAADPAAVAADLVGAFWARRMQAVALSVLKGVFSIASMSSHLLALNRTDAGAVATGHTLNGLTWIDATQMLGDYKDRLTAAIMHSAVEASLAKLDLIEWVEPSQGGERIRTFQGKRVVIDDGMPVDVVAGNARYTTYLFGRGALALGTSRRYGGQEVDGGFGTWGAEFFREALAGNSGMITRRRFILHPHGIKWLGASQAGPTPTNAELATAANWLRVWDPKNIPMVAVQHNILA